MLDTHKIWQLFFGKLRLKQYFFRTSLTGKWFGIGKMPNLSYILSYLCDIIFIFIDLKA